MKYIGKYCIMMLSVFAMIFVITPNFNAQEENKAETGGLEVTGKIEDFSEFPYEPTAPDGIISPYDGYN
jgi:hypothetical protein